MVPQWIIEQKRDGKALAEADIRDFIAGYAAGDIPDYQMAALAMAVYFRGMTFEEVTVLTDAMMDSGVVLDTSGIAAPTADKHSTGGIGDKISLPLAPLAACCGVAVPMISGRGLGITGGTLDKLESIPGYRTDLTTNQFLHTVNTCGCSIIGQTAELAPADRKLYALRDVTGTVPSIPLISASIMSKKLAESTDALVLDVKWGAGAFMKTQEQARELAETMVQIGTRSGRRMTAVLTDMNQPLGHTAGNAVEVAETVDVLRGEGPPDVVELTLELGTHMLLLTGRADTREDATGQLRAAIDSGAGLAKFREMVSRQGGNVEVIDDPSRLPAASIDHVLEGPADGTVTGVDAEAIGRACVALGAGRRRVEDAVDHAVGIRDLVKVGRPVEAGQPLARVLANDPGRLAEALKLLENAVTVSGELREAAPLILDVIQGETTT
jgi:pyrimidine-nucleoside phosphorylase